MCYSCCYLSLCKFFLWCLHTMESPRDIFLRMYPVLTSFGSSHSWALGEAGHWSKGSSLVHSAYLRGTWEIGFLGMSSGWSSYEINVSYKHELLLIVSLSVMMPGVFLFSMFPKTHFYYFNWYKTESKAVVNSLPHPHEWGKRRKFHQASPFIRKGGLYYWE